MTYLQKRTHTCIQLKRKTIHWNNEIINIPFEGRDIVFYEKFTKRSYHLNSSYPYVSYDTNIYKFCPPPFPNDHSTYSWGWVESQGGGGNIFINSSWSCQLGVKVISHQSVKSFCCTLVLKIIFTLPQFTLKVKNKVCTWQAVNSVVYHNFSAICFVAILPPSINWVLVEQMISFQLHCYTT